MHARVAAVTLGLLLWPGLALGLARRLLVGRFASTHALVDDWYDHAQYFGVFLLGFLVARRDGFRDAAVRLHRPALLLWLPSWAGLAAYMAHFARGEPPDGLHLAMRVAWGVDQWCAIVAVPGLARRLAPGDSPLLHYLAAAVFPVHILHQTVIVVLAHRLKPLDLPPLAEGPLLVLATFALCLARYELVRRVPLLRPLFGLKREAAARGARTRAAEPAG